MVSISNRDAVCSHSTIIFHKYSLYFPLNLIPLPLTTPLYPYNLMHQYMQNLPHLIKCLIIKGHKYIVKFIFSVVLSFTNFLILDFMGKR